MEERGEPEDVEVGPLLPADAEAESENPFCMIPVVAAPGAAEEGLGLLSDPLEGLRGKTVPARRTFRRQGVGLLRPPISLTIHIDSINSI
jgi:hypothetical protein